MKICDLIYNGSVISAEDISASIDNYKLKYSEYSEIILPEKCETPEMIATVIAVYSSGLPIILSQNKEYPILHEHLSQWLEFCHKLFQNKGISSVYIENSSEVMGSLVWLAGLECECKTEISDNPKEANLAIVSLNAVLEKRISLNNYKYVITCGTEQADFSEYSNKDTLWVNFYGFPYCLCVSYSKKCIISGKNEIHHQLKPVMGFSAFVADKSGNEVPANVIGTLMQTINDNTFCTPFRAVFTSDGTLFADDIVEGYTFVGGKLFKTTDIVNTLVKCKGITDCAVFKNMVYYTVDSSFDISCLMAIESDIPCANELIFRKAPYIPKLSNGNTDFKKLESLTDDIYDICSSAEKIIKNKYTEISSVDICYADKPEIIINCSGNIADVAKEIESISKGYTVKLYNDKNTEPEIIVDSELTTLQKQLIEIWKNTLGIEKVDIDDDFFKLGGTSMLLIKLAFEISDKLNIDIQIQDVMLFNTVRKLADHIDSSNNTDEFSKKLQMMSEDAKCKINIEEKLHGISSSDNTDILVIGSPEQKCLTVINELMKNEAHIVFLTESTQNNVFSAMNSLQLDNNTGTIKVINGDITKSDFGLTHEIYEELAGSIKVVYDFGLDLNLIASYEALREKNICGTENVIRFCCDVCSKRLVYISSIAVLKVTSCDKLAVCTENTSVTSDMIQKYSNKDYIYSAYAADNLVQDAHNHGIDAVIIRSPRIMGETVTGKFNNQDIIWLLIRYLIQKKLSPEIYIMQEFISPADVLAKQIIGIAQLHDTRTFIYNLKGVESKASDILDWVNSKFDGLCHITMEEWKNLVKNDSSYEDHIVTPMLGHLSIIPGEDIDTSAVSDELTLDILHSNNICTYEGHTLNEILDTTYKYLKNIGFFEEREK